MLYELSKHMSEYFYYASIATTGSIAAAALFWAYSRRRRASLPEYSKRPIVSHIILYPIEGCRGIERYSAEVTVNGLVHDRDYAIVEVDKANPDTCQAVSQAETPTLALIVPSSITADSITVSSPGHASLMHHAVPKGKRYSFDFYGAKIEAIDQGDKAADWFSSFLSKKVRFVKLAAAVNPKDSSRKQTKATSSYRTPIHVVSKESLKVVSAKVGNELVHDRLRPNMVIAGVLPFIEDLVDEIKIGSLSLTGEALCRIEPSKEELDTALLSQLGSVRGAETLVSVNEKYKSKIKVDELYLGVNFTASLKTGNSTRIFVGQEVDM